MLQSYYNKQRDFMGDYGELQEKIKGNKCLILTALETKSKWGEWGIVGKMLLFAT